MIDLPRPALIGMVHLPALPGTPRHLLSMDEIVDRALADAKMLHDAGFDALIVENYGDAPFSPDTLPPACVAAMSIVTDRIRREIALPLGINALRNDARAALAIAAAAGGSFVRINVFTGVAATDQGIIEGRAEQTLAYRKQLGKRIAILADVHVKHAVPLSEPDIARAARDAAYRGFADGLIVSGPATGEPVNMDELRRVRAAVPDRRVLVGSGATIENADSLLAIADGIIVGTAIKADGRTDAPVDPRRAAAFVHAAGRARNV